MLKKYYEHPKKETFMSDLWFAVSLLELFVAFILALLFAWEILLFRWLLLEFLVYGVLSFRILWAKCKKLTLKRQYKKED